MSGKRGVGAVNKNAVNKNVAAVNKKQASEENRRIEDGVGKEWGVGNEVRTSVEEKGSNKDAQRPKVSIKENPLWSDLCGEDADPDKDPAIQTSSTSRAARTSRCPVDLAG